MSGFTLQLTDNTRRLQVPDVVSFVGVDASGSFGLLAGHARFMTALVFGLARFRSAGAAWQYLAMPGALLYFDNNVLRLNTRRYLLGPDYADMSRALEEQLAREERNLTEMKRTLHHIETQVLKQMLEMNKPVENLA